MSDTDKVAMLRGALAEAGAVLEALNAAVTWELAPILKDDIKRAVWKTRDTLKRTKAKSDR